MFDERLPGRAALIGMGLTLALFYWGDALPLAPVPQLVALAVFAELALLRPDLALLLVPATAPLYLIPAQIPGLRAEPVRLPLHEVTLLVTAAATAGRWALERWSVGALERKAESGKREARDRSPERFNARTLLRFLPHILFLIAGVAGVLLAVPEGRGAALREFRWLVAEPLLFYGLLRAQIGREPEMGRHAALALVASGVAVAAIGLLQVAGLDLAPLFGEKQNFGTANVVDAAGVRRATSVYGHPNNLGLFLGRVWPLAAALALFGAQSAERRVQSARLPISWPWALSALVCLAGIAASFSRGAWLGALAAGAALALGLALDHGRRTADGGRRSVVGGRWPVAGGLGALILLAVIAAFALTLRGGVGGGSADARVLLWREALALMRAHPLGLGLDQFYYYHNPEFGRSIMDPALAGTSEQYASHPHNLVLDAYLNLGPLGLAALAWLTARGFRWGLRALRAGPVALALGALAAMTAALVHGVVDVFYFVEDLALVFWLLLALAEET